MPKPRVIFAIIFFPLLLLWSFSASAECNPIDDCLLQLCIGAAEDIGQVEVSITELPPSVVVALSTQLADIGLAHFSLYYIDENGDEVLLGTVEGPGGTGMIISVGYPPLPIATPFYLGLEVSVIDLSDPDGDWITARLCETGVPPLRARLYHGIDWLLVSIPPD